MCVYSNVAVVVPLVLDQTFDVVVFDAVQDNASISLDVLLSYKVVNPKVMLYSSQNLPRMISKVLQAQVRAVAGSLDVDAIIEETATMDRVAGELGAVASRWGVAGTWTHTRGICLVVVGEHSDRSPLEPNRHPFVC